MSISEATLKLIDQYKAAKNVEKAPEGASLIHVDEVASKVAAFYEHIRTVVEWKEEHLMRRAAITRKLKRKFLEINMNAGELVSLMAEGLVMELIRGGHFANDTISESKIPVVTDIFSKYIALLEHNPENKEGKAGLQFYNWLLEVAACEIEDALAPAVKEKALIEYMFWQIKEQVKVPEKAYEEKLLRKGDEDIQLYIAVCQSLFRLDTPIISYDLLKLKYPKWQQADNQIIQSVAKDIFKIYNEIQQDLAHPLSHKFYALCERYDTPYLLLGDILSAPDFDQDQVADPSSLENKVREAYKKRLALLKNKITRAAIYLTLSIFLSKILLLVVLQLVIDWLLQNQANPGILILDILIPTFLMFVLVAFIKKPSQRNINKVVMETMKIVYHKENSDVHEIKLNRKKNIATRIGLSLLYALSTCITFGIIYFALSALGFPITSIFIDIIFIALILFAGTAISKRAQELTMEDEKENVMSFVADIFFLPLQGLGRWISNTWRQYNAIAAFFNALIDMPFTAFIEFLEGWRYFIRERKEEIR